MNENKSSEGVKRVLASVRELSERSVRDRKQCFWIEGIRHFVQACDARMQFEAIVESPVLNPSRLAEMLARRLAATGVPRFKVSPEQFRSVCSGRASGIGGIVRQNWTDPGALRLAEPEQSSHSRRDWLIILRIRSPGNLGTIMRTAEAVGMRGIVFVGNAADPFDPVALRASMGGLFHLTLMRMGLSEFRNWVRQHAIVLVGLSPEAAQLWTENAEGEADVARHRDGQHDHEKAAYR